MGENFFSFVAIWRAYHNSYAEITNEYAQHKRS